MTVLGAIKYRTRLLTGCSGATLLCYLLLVLGCFYCDDPLNGFKWKIVGFCTFVAGIALGRSAADISQFRKDMRLLLIPLGAGAILMLQQVIMSGSVKRLETMGNPNAIAIIAASAMCVSAYLAIWDTVKILRIVSIPSAIAFGIVLISTGSRGPTGAAIIAIVILSFPLFKHPLRLAIVSALALVTISCLSDKVDIEKPFGRLVSMERWDQDRLAMWTERFESNRNWIIGNGGRVEDDGNGRMSWANMHSIYVQIMYELGYCGAIAFASAFLYTFFKGIKLLFHCPVPEKWLAFSLIVLPMGIGMFESLPLLGNSISTVWWGMGLGLLDELSRGQQAEPVQKVNERQRAMRAVPEGIPAMPKPLRS